MSKKPGAVMDNAAILARAEQVIDVLRTSYVCEGWKLDEEGASRTLRYFRSRVAGSPDEDEERYVIEFLGDHGQSLDWVIAGDPGSMICARAKHSTQAAKVAAHDPIFAVIERAREAETAFDEEEIDDEAHHLLDKAIAELARTVPTTSAGLVALTTFLRFAHDNLHEAAPYFENGTDAAAFAASLDTAVHRMVEMKALATRHPVDSELSAAEVQIAANDLALTGLHKAYGDDADSRDDYLQISDERLELLELLATRKARSWSGIEAKARALLSEDLDYERAGKIARSMAKDVLRVS